MIFLGKSNTKVSFAHRLIQLIMLRVQTISFSILINGLPTAPIIYSSRLRQGDPLSPYLFILCTEGLIGQLKAAENNGSIMGVKICREAPRFNHLLLSNNSILFYKADMIANRHIQLLLKHYELVLGQKINSNKTAMVFSNNNTEEVKGTIMSM